MTEADPAPPGAVVLLVTGASVPPGLLTAEAWDVLRELPVCCGLADHPQREALEAAGVAVSVLGSLDGGATPIPDAADLRAHAPLVWLADPGRYGAPGADAELVAQLRALPGVREVIGSVDPPGARLLDAVAVMDRLRSPGGCPWDAEQTIDSLKRYLIEEAYEAYEAAENGDLAELRDELGDVLLQVLFNARVAVETDDFDIDDVAAGLVAKLVRRHPHVFSGETGADSTVSSAAEVQTSWDAIKATERAAKNDGVPVSPLAEVPMGLPALSLAAKLQTRAAKAGLGTGLPPGAHAAGSGAGSGIGEMLFAAVAVARAAGVDPEEALRGTARAYRDAQLGLPSLGQSEDVDTA